MQQTCALTGQAFTINDDDLRLLKTLAPVIGGQAYELPPPTLSPHERQRRRVAFGNQLNLYERTCDLTGQRIISMFSPDGPYRVYSQPDWYSDKWNAFDFGRDVDFSQPFFPQFADLMVAVPKPSLLTGYEYDENCEYTNHAGKNKDCYLIFDSDENRDCYYSYSLNHCENCMDCFRARKCHLCYEAIDSVQCYNCAYVQDCENCADSAFLKNCIGCKKCLMCSNLRNKEYYVENKPVSPEQFNQFRAALTARSRIDAAQQRFAKLKLDYPQKYMHGVQNEAVVGDYLVQCKDAYQCYDSEDLWDCRYVFQGFMPLKNCMDIQECGDAEKLYDCAFSGYGSQSMYFCTHSLSQDSDLFYCAFCYHCKNCFGCTGLRHKQYCIFNKQYSQEEYEKLVPQLIEHMRKTKEWGEFFPAQHSCFGYNETLAQDYYPLQKDQVAKLGWKWSEALEKKDKHSGQAAQPPDDISQTDESVIKQVYQCTASGKAFKIIEQELMLAKQLGVPLPAKCFFQRHRERLAMRNPRYLHQRQCGKCDLEIWTTYSPERPEKVLCEKCYLEEVY